MTPQQHQEIIHEIRRIGDLIHTWALTFGKIIVLGAVLIFLHTLLNVYKSIT